MEMTDGVFDAPQLMTVQHVARDANNEPMADAHVARDPGIEKAARDGISRRLHGGWSAKDAYRRSRATATSFTLVPVGPVMMRPPTFWRAW